MPLLQLPDGSVLPLPYGDEDDEGEPLDELAAADRSPEELLREMLRLAGEYRTVERDDEDLLAIERVTTLVQQLLAAQQKERDGLLSGGLNPRAIRRLVG